MLLNESSQLAELVAAEPAGIRKQNRREPELRVAFRLLDMDMRGLAILSAPEVEPVPGNTQDGWHVEESTPRSAEKQGVAAPEGSLTRPRTAINERSFR